MQGYSRGITEFLGRLTMDFPIRIWIVDNSGSMILNDGCRLVETSDRANVRLVKCTRWDELRETVSYHARMASLLRAATRFRLLNHPGPSVGPQTFSIAVDASTSEPIRSEMDAQEAIRIMQRAHPRGVTPLTEHVLAVHDQVERMAPSLRARGQRAVVILATDGLPSDDQGHGGQFISNQFVQALRLLSSLPVWIVIRLCTDDPEVVKFYSELDENLELNLEVLDDFVNESREVAKHNPWLNYALPLHRCREMGFSNKILDLLDERPLTKSEISRFCSLLFGEDRWDEVPDPDVDWYGFLRSVEGAAKEEGEQWNPVRKRVEPWINVKRLDYILGERRTSIVSALLVALAALILAAIFFFILD